MSEGAVRSERRCRIWFCREAERALCCADCRERDACLERCLNWPSRCGCAARVELNARGDAITYKIV